MGWCCVSFFKDEFHPAVLSQLWPCHALVGTVRQYGHVLWNQLWMTQCNQASTTQIVTFCCISILWPFGAVLFELNYVESIKQIWSVWSLYKQNQNLTKHNILSSAHCCVLCKWNLCSFMCFCLLFFHNLNERKSILCFFFHRQLSRYTKSVEIVLALFLLILDSSIYK